MDLSPHRRLVNKKILLITLQRFYSHKPAKIKAVINYQWISGFFFFKRKFNTWEIYISISNICTNEILEHTQKDTFLILEKSHLQWHTGWFILQNVKSQWDLNLPYGLRVLYSQSSSTLMKSTGCTANYLFIWVEILWAICKLTLDFGVLETIRRKL